MQGTYSITKCLGSAKPIKENRNGLHVSTALPSGRHGMCLFNVSVEKHGPLSSLAAMFFSAIGFPSCAMNA